MSCKFFKKQIINNSKFQDAENVILDPAETDTTSTEKKDMAVLNLGEIKKSPTFVKAVINTNIYCAPKSSEILTGNSMVEIFVDNITTKIKKQKKSRISPDYSKDEN